MRFLMLLLLALMTGCYSTLDFVDTKEMSSQDLCAAQMNPGSLSNADVTARRELASRGQNCR